MFKQTAVAIGVAVLLSGCAKSVVCTPDTNVPLETSSLPAKSSATSKVIVLPVDIEYKDPAAKRMQAIVRDTIEGQIVETGTQLVDRKVANKLKSEIKLAEKSGRYNTKGVPIADYAVISEITSSDLSKSFQEAYTYKDKDGNYHKVPAKCMYEADVKGVMKVYSLPEMDLVKRIDLSGDENQSTETRNSSCPISKGSYVAMARKAAEEAVSYSTELKSMLAASAPVIEMRQCKDSGSIVRIGVGSKRNVQPKMDVAFSHRMKNSEGEVETFQIGEGYVLNNPRDAVKPNYSWVAVDDELALKIKKGDSAQLIMAKCKNILDLECQAGAVMDKVTQ